MRVYSVERRFQRYAIIYIWKIMENQVQNYGLKWTSNDRKGRMVDIPKRSDSALGNKLKRPVGIKG